MTEQSHESATLPKLLERNASLFATRPAYREKRLGIWRTWTWLQTQEAVHALAAGFLTLGATRGDYIAVVGHNRPHLYWAMIAAQFAGATPLLLPRTLDAAATASVLASYGVRFAVVGGQEEVDNLLRGGDDVPLRHLMYLDRRGLRKYDDARLHDFDAIHQDGYKKVSTYRADIDRHGDASPKSPAVVLFHRDTMQPVRLSHRELSAIAENACTLDKLNEQENVLACLPMDSADDFILSVSQAYWTGFCLNCPENAETMSANMKEIGPGYFVAPARFYEELFASVTARMENAHPFKRRLFRACMDGAAHTGTALLDGASVGVAARLKYRVGKGLIYAPLLNALGIGNIRIAYAVAGDLKKETLLFYRSLGVNLKQTRPYDIPSDKDDEIA